MLSHVKIVKSNQIWRGSEGFCVSLMWCPVSANPSQWDASPGCTPPWRRSVRKHVQNQNVATSRPAKTHCIHHYPEGGCSFFLFLSRQFETVIISCGASSSPCPSPRAAPNMQFFQGARCSLACNSFASQGGNHWKIGKSEIIELFWWQTSWTTWRGRTRKSGRYCISSTSSTNFARRYWHQLPHPNAFPCVCSVIRHFKCKLITF